MTIAIKPMSLKIDLDLRERLKKLAHNRKRSAHSIAREAVENYVVREEARDHFAQDALDAWQHYQETGLHATGDEVMTWIESWGTDKELPPPVCHT
ncbi:MAG: CopG family ribbon-helix-helix protein [Gallionella sp.]